MPPRQRGRCRGRRWITEIPEVTHFSPPGVPLQVSDTVYLSFEELETLRLVDLEGMEQAQAAFYMGISRKTLWNDLKSARKKVALALVNGRAIRIEGGNYALRGK